jgi:hypothetical protein
VTNAAEVQGHSGGVVPDEPPAAPDATPGMIEIGDLLSGQLAAAEVAELPPGLVERAVHDDIAALPEGATKGRAVLVSLALMIARVLDREADDVGVSSVAKASDSLRVIMELLNRPRGDEANDLVAELLGRLSAPVRHETDS